MRCSSWSSESSVPQGVDYGAQRGHDGVRQRVGDDGHGALLQFGEADMTHQVDVRPPGVVLRSWPAPGTAVTHAVMVTKPGGTTATAANGTPGGGGGGPPPGVPPPEEPPPEVPPPEVPPPDVPPPDVLPPPRGPSSPPSPPPPPFGRGRAATPPPPSSLSPAGTASSSVDETNSRARRAGRPGRPPRGRRHAAPYGRWRAQWAAARG